MCEPVVVGCDRPGLTGRPDPFKRSQRPAFALFSPFLSMTKSSAPERKSGCSAMERLPPEITSLVLDQLAMRHKAALRLCSSTMYASVTKSIKFLARGVCRRGDGGR
jgi:hypothetical protein